MGKLKQAISEFEEQNRDDLVERFVNDNEDKYWELVEEEYNDYNANFCDTRADQLKDAEAEELMLERGRDKDHGID